MSARPASYACTSVPITRPRLVLASAAVEAPVPPSARARSVIPEMLPPVISKLLPSISTEPAASFLPRVICSPASVVTKVR